MVLLCEPDTVTAEQTFLEQGRIAVDDKHLAFLVAGFENLDDMAEDIRMQQHAEVIDNKRLVTCEAFKESNCQSCQTSEGKGFKSEEVRVTVSLLVIDVDMREYRLP